MSFLLDIGLLNILGILIAYICKKRYKEDSFLVYTLSGILLYASVIVRFGFNSEISKASNFIKIPLK